MSRSAPAPGCRSPGHGAATASGPCATLRPVDRVVNHAGHRALAAHAQVVGRVHVHRPDIDRLGCLPVDAVPAGGVLDRGRRTPSRRTAGRPAAAVRPPARPGLQTPADHGSGARCGRGALRPPRHGRCSDGRGPLPGPAPTASLVPPVRNPISHPAAKLGHTISIGHGRRRLVASRTPRLPGRPCAALPSRGRRTLLARCPA